MKNRTVLLACMGSIFFLILVFSGIIKLPGFDPPLDAAPAAGTITKSLVDSKNLSLHEAMYYESSAAGSDVVCLLCPRECTIHEGDTGDCRVRANIGGKLYSLVYGRPVTIHIDPIEKKPLFHFYPQSKTFSFATTGCNLHCINCQNWNISQLSPFDMDSVATLEPKDIVALCEKEGLSSISYTYNDPVVFYEYVLDTARLAHAKGIKNVLVTAGYINQEPLKNLCPYIDAATVDIKSMSKSFYRRFNTAKLQPVLDALVTMKKAGVWLEVSFLVIPGENDTDEELGKFSGWVRDNLGAETPVHFLRFFPLYKLTMKPPTPANTLKRAARIAKDAGLKYVYIGNLPESGVEDTFCPHCGKKIIARDGFTIRELNIKNGRCEYCGAAINGRW